MTTEAELSALTVPKLKERLTALGLSTSGKKADLIARLLESAPAPAAETKTPATDHKNRAAAADENEQEEVAEPVQRQGKTPAKTPAKSPAAQTLPPHPTSSKKRKSDAEPAPEAPKSTKTTDKKRQKQEAEAPVGDELPADLLAQVAAHQSQRQATVQAARKAKVVKTKQQTKLEAKKAFKKAALKGEVEVGPVKLRVLQEEAGRPSVASVTAKEFLQQRMQVKVQRSATMVPPRGASAKLSQGVQRAKAAPAMNFAGKKDAGDSEKKAGKAATGGRWR